MGAWTSRQRSKQWREHKHTQIVSRVRVTSIPLNCQIVSRHTHFCGYGPGTWCIHPFGGLKNLPQVHQLDRNCVAAEFAYQASRFFYHRLAHYHFFQIKNQITRPFFRSHARPRDSWPSGRGGVTEVCLFSTSVSSRVP